MTDEDDELDGDGATKPFLEHLEDLRSTIIRSLVALICGIVLVAFFVRPIIDLLEQPLVNAGYDPDAVLKMLQVTSPIAVGMNVAFWGGLILSAPLILYYIGQFVFPGLTRKEKNLILRGFFFVVLLFAGGICMGYFVTAEQAIRVFFGAADKWIGKPIELLELQNYISFILKLLLGFGLAFQFPMIVMLLGYSGLVGSRSLKEHRPHTAVGLLIAAMILTPPDPGTQLMMAIPLAAMYEVCIWLIWMKEKRDPDFVDPDEDPDDDQNDEQAPSGTGGAAGTASGGAAGAIGGTQARTRTRSGGHGMEDGIYLGIDSSTQSLKALAVNAKLETVFEETIQFDKDLPRFETNGGVHKDDTGLRVTSPPQLWVAALDMLLERMRDQHFDFGRVVAISGSGQQHGSVFLKKEARERLNGLHCGMSLEEAMEGVYSVDASPIWMDSSTTAECAAREEALGGAQAVAELTGSRAYERFTGNQIAKIAAEQPEAYDATDRIALVSSFMASLFIGDYAPIDYSDASGMNMMNIRTRDWDDPALDCTAKGLRDRLGPVAQSHAVIGKVHGYFVEEYGMDPDCDVVAFSGDNPCSLAGLRLQRPGDIAISMGTSDTIFGALAEPKPSATEGHIFANPVDPDGYMALVCYKNGSLTREMVRDDQADGSWDTFQGLLEHSVPGNDGRIGFYFKEPEITPPVLKAGIHRFDEEGQPVDEFAPEEDVRAVVEGQFLSMRLHCGNIGIEPRAILATGGGSQNTGILQIMADVFGVPVMIAEAPNSASLGAAYRALHGHLCSAGSAFIPFEEILKKAPGFMTAASPEPESHAIYSGMLSRYAELEQRVIEG